VPQLPSLSHVLEDAGTWGRIVREVDVSQQRLILNELVVRVVLRRTGYRAYAADITRTPLGDALRRPSSAE
jgi:hypothetical protein